MKEIREPVNGHRLIEARKFSNRMDFIDLTAFGVGIEIEDKDIHKDECEKIDKDISRYCTRYGNLISKLEVFDSKLQ